MSPSTSYIDTVVIGSGPAGLLLSYILSGNTPRLRKGRPHPDAQLQAKLDLLFSPPNSNSPPSTPDQSSPSSASNQLPGSLFSLDVPHLTSHFQASRISYSTQALPVNTLLDTLLRPLGDTEPGEYESCIEWIATGNKVPHVVLGSAPTPGGQWAENPVTASWDIGALSYAELLSLPGWRIEEYLLKHGREGSGDESVEFLRPTRRDVAGYMAEWPRVTGIQKNIQDNQVVSDVQRTESGFYIGSHGIHCKHLVLASGIFSRLKPPRPPLQPLLQLPADFEHKEPPLLVVGSGFSAADLIITHLPKRKIIHIFKWDPVDCVSPLRACHPQAYPEYASVYRRMKATAKKLLGEDSLASPTPRKKSVAYFDSSQQEMNYEGLPNTWIREAKVENGTGWVKLELPNGSIVERQVSGFNYVIGRRGNMDYLDTQLQEEVLGPGVAADTISGRTLRSKVEADIEVAPNVFAVGSLVGDSLIRHSYGTCVTAAGEIIRRNEEARHGDSGDSAKNLNSGESSNGVSHTANKTEAVPPEAPTREYLSTNGHDNLGFWNRARRRLSDHAEDLENTKKKRGGLISECIVG